MRRLEEMAHISAGLCPTRNVEPAVEETIRFNEAEDEDGFLIREESTVINILPSRSGQKLSTSKLRVRNFVDYGWEPIDGTGRFIATHISGQYIAYVVKVANVGAIRILDLNTNERALIKGVKGLTRDVEFMHKMDELVIGFIDEYGTFYVHKILKDLKTGKLQTFPIISVDLDGSPSRIPIRRFLWCKYVPFEEGDIGTVRDCAYHFAVIQDNMIYISNIIQLVQKFGEGRHSWPDLRGYFMTIDTHSDAVYDASFAPDGTALATACKDGTVKFFQVYVVGDEPPRCLFSWSPHNGQPVSRILFLDDHTLGSAADCQYWKFLITAAHNESEVKLWSCRSWTCLQTLQFSSPLPSQLRLEIDLQARFLVIGDVKRKVMFVLHLEHDEEGARFVWINEFSIPASLLSYNITEASLVPLEAVLAKNEATQLEEFVRRGENTKKPICVLGLYFIQAKSLQYGKVIFVPPTTLSHINGHSPSRITFGRSVSYSNENQDTPHRQDSEDADIEDAEEDGQIVNIGSMPSTKSKMNIGSGSAVKSVSPISRPRQERQSVSPRREEDMNRGSSPRNPSTSVTQMTQQLSNLMGLGNEGCIGTIGLGGNMLGPHGGSVDRTYSTKSPDMIQLHTPSPFGSIMTDNIVMQSETRPRTSSLNGNGSNASSSPSREVEEILSPKNTDLIGRRSQTSQSTEGVMNNLDMEGNVVLGGDLLNKNRRGISPKTKTLSTTEVTPQLPQVLEQVSSILDMMSTQASEMKELKREVSRMNTVQSLAHEMDEKAVLRALESYFTNNQIQMQRIEESLSMVQSQEKIRISQTQLITPNLPEVLAEKLGRALKSEIEVCVLPNVMKMFEPTKTHLQNETLKLIQTAEGRIGQEMKLFLQSHDFKKSVVPVINETMRKSLLEVVAEVFVSTILPGFEKSLHAMFLKINDSFLKGTKEYISGLEATMDMRRSQQETSQDVLKQQFNSLQDSLGTSLQVELETQLIRGIGMLQVGLLKQVEETMSRELSKAMGEQQRLLETSISTPRTSTPAVSLSEQNSASRPSVDLATMRRQLFHLIDIGDIPSAFIQASRYGDGTLILEMAEKVHPSKVFVPSLPIQTAVYLIQLFVTDINHSTDTKIQYLHTALSLLNLSSDKRVHASLHRIIPIFQLSAKSYRSTYPDSHHNGNLKILEMAFLGHAGQGNVSVLTPSNSARENQHNISSQQLFGLLKQEVGEPAHHHHLS